MLDFPAEPAPRTPGVGASGGAAARHRPRPLPAGARPMPKRQLRKQIQDGIREFSSARLPPRRSPGEADSGAPGARGVVHARVGRMLSQARAKARGQRCAAPSAPGARGGTGGARAAAAQTAFPPVLSPDSALVEERLSGRCCALLGAALSAIVSEESEELCSEWIASLDPRDAERLFLSASLHGQVCSAAAKAATQCSVERLCLHGFYTDRDLASALLAASRAPAPAEDDWESIAEDTAPEPLSGLRELQVRPLDGCAATAAAAAEALPGLRRLAVQGDLPPEIFYDEGAFLHALSPLQRVVPQLEGGVLGRLSRLSRIEFYNCRSLSPEALASLAAALGHRRSPCEEIRALACGVDALAATTAAAAWAAARRRGAAGAAEGAEGDVDAPLPRAATGGEVEAAEATLRYLAEGRGQRCCLVPAVEARAEGGRRLRVAYGDGAAALRDAPRGGAPSMAEARRAALERLGEGSDEVAAGTSEAAPAAAPAARGGSGKRAPRPAAQPVVARRGRLSAEEMLRGVCSEEELRARVGVVLPRSADRDEDWRARGRAEG